MNAKTNQNFYSMIFKRLTLSTPLTCAKNRLHPIFFDKNCTALLFKLILLCLIISCSLEKEGAIPDGATNETPPVISSLTIEPDSNDQILIKAFLSNVGNLTVKNYGFVWSNMPNPTLKDSIFIADNLTQDSFSYKTSFLSAEKTYYIRPFVTNSSTTAYGTEHCYSTNIVVEINTDKEIYEGAIVRFTNQTLNAKLYDWFWDFGDGNTSREVSPTHTFTTKGNRKVQVLASNESCSSKKIILFSVIDNPLANYWVFVKGGTFRIGSNKGTAEEWPDHNVTLSDFFIGRTEITQYQWRSVMGHKILSYYHGFSRCDNCPMENISWEDIQLFTNKLQLKNGKNIRMPTEAEWEYAAKGGVNSKGYIYAGSNNIDEVAWYSLNGPGFLDQTTYKVALKKPNELGLYDMTGNVAEWCLDWYESYTYLPKTNPKGPDQGLYKVYRGGYIQSVFFDSRVSYRLYYLPTIRDRNIGVRLVYQP